MLCLEQYGISGVCLSERLLEEYKAPRPTRSRVVMIGRDGMCRPGRKLALNPMKIPSHRKKVIHTPIPRKYGRNIKVNGHSGTVTNHVYPKNWLLPVYSGRGARENLFAGYVIDNTADVLSIVQNGVLDMGRYKKAFLRRIMETLVMVADNHHDSTVTIEYYGDDGPIDISIESIIQDLKLFFNITETNLIVQGSVYTYIRIPHVVSFKMTHGILPSTLVLYIFIPSREDNDRPENEQVLPCGRPEDEHE